jgi:hypothetical protein
MGSEMLAEYMREADERIRQQDWSYHPYAFAPEFAMEVSDYVSKIMGVLGEAQAYMSPYTSAVSKLRSAINSLPDNNTAASVLRDYLKSIIEIYVIAATTPTRRYNKPNSTISMYQIYSKFLTGITCGDQEVSLSYQDVSEKRQLESVALLNYFRDTISFVQLEIQQDLLKKLTFKNPLDSLSKSQQFSYFNTTDQRGADIFGYYNGSEGIGVGTIDDAYPFIGTPMVNAYNIQHQFDSIMFSDGHHDADHVKMHTLKNIKTSGGSEIVLDYEPNQLFFFGENYDAGGIRIKNMILKDGTGSVDSVHYHYTKEEGESSGRMMLRPARGKMLFYASYFADQVYSEEVEDEGHGIFNTGNNGIIYDYVIEEHVGSGSIAYYSHTPAELYETTLGYPYWLMGLPLGKVEYDVEGRRVSMQKNSYYASLAPFYSNAPPGVYTGRKYSFSF